MKRITKGKKMTIDDAMKFETFDYNGDMDYIRDDAVYKRMNEVFEYFNSNRKETLCCANCEKYTNKGFCTDDIIDNYTPYTFYCKHHVDSGISLSEGDLI